MCSMVFGSARSTTLTARPPRRLCQRPRPMWSFCPSEVVFLGGQNRMNMMNIVLLNDVSFGFSIQLSLVILVILSKVILDGSTRRLHGCFVWPVYERDVFGASEGRGFCFLDYLGPNSKVTSIRKVLRRGNPIWFCPIKNGLICFHFSPQVGQEVIKKCDMKIGPYPLLFFFECLAVQKACTQSWMLRGIIESLRHPEKESSDPDRFLAFFQTWGCRNTTISSSNSWRENFLFYPYIYIYIYIVSSHWSPVFCFFHKILLLNHT